MFCTVPESEHYGGVWLCWLQF